ncbi:hypothetical protein BLA60_19500 [Actinophytocola xinjiangensis]|uniref:Uncharacterized protein n=1 Tax=Actinophytocola xinjiangensis TaxID=485602 RepID=A0A7Z0WKW0_9PSEU|nr:hypothetical protein BLA60_19500 [Actinophytocola xinjiangensis]
MCSLFGGEHHDISTPAPAEHSGEHLRTILIRSELMPEVAALTRFLKKEIQLSHLRHRVSALNDIHLPKCC